MSRDLSWPLQVAVLAKLEGDPLITAHVPAEKVVDYVDASMSMPFIRYGAAIISPYNASCVNGSRMDITIHAFAKNHGRKECSEISAAIVEVLDGADLQLSGEPVLNLQHTQTQMTEDLAEQGAWHGIVEFTAIAGIDA